MTDATKAMVEALQFARTDITAAIKFVEHDLGDGEARGLRQTLMRIEAALTAAKSEWQPIKMTSPVEHEDVLLYLPDSAYRPVVIGYLSMGDWLEVEGDGGVCIDVAVTHWRPLPEPPQP